MSVLCDLPITLTPVKQLSEPLKGVRRNRVTAPSSKRPSSHAESQSPHVRTRRRRRNENPDEMSPTALTPANNSLGEVERPDSSSRRTSRTERLTSNNAPSSRLAWSPNYRHGHGFGRRKRHPPPQSSPSR